MTGFEVINKQGLIDFPIRIKYGKKTKNIK